MTPTPGAGGFEGHTPGPWKAMPIHASLSDGEHTHYLTCGHGALGYWGHKRKDGHDFWVLTEADASLIASAPQILADLTALRERVAELEGEHRVAQSVAQEYELQAQSAEAECSRLRARCAAKDALIRRLIETAAPFEAKGGEIGAFDGIDPLSLGAAWGDPGRLRVALDAARKGAHP